MPVVTFGIGSVRDSVVHNKTGFISDANINKFANFMDQLVNNNKLQKKFFDKVD